MGGYTLSVFESLSTGTAPREASIPVCNRPNNNGNQSGLGISSDFVIIDGEEVPQGIMAMDVCGVLVGHDGSPLVPLPTVNNLTPTSLDSLIGSDALTHPISSSTSSISPANLYALAGAARGRFLHARIK